MKLPVKHCPECGAEFQPPRFRSKYCSRPCMWKNNGLKRGESTAWWVNHDGYIAGEVLIEGKYRIVRQHRWLMEQHLGRKLELNEHVHHINGQKTDNRIENLMVLSSSAHATLTHTGNRYLRGRKLDLSLEERQSRSARIRALNAKRLRGPGPEELRDDLAVTAVAVAAGETC